MEKADFDQKLNPIRDEFNKKFDRLAAEYAYSNNSHAIGDIIQDHYQIIKIEEIGVYFPSFQKYPKCVYTGPRYTKGGKPFKNGARSEIHEGNIISSKKGDS